MKALRLSIFVIITWLMAGVPKSKADISVRDVPLFKPYRLGLGLEAQSFKSTANFSEEGFKQDLLDGHSFETYDLQIKATYDWSEFWSAQLGLTLAYGESYNGLFRRSARRLKGLNFGAFRLLQFRPGRLFVLDGHAYMNFTENSLAEDEVSIGDGAPWGQVGAWWVHEISKHFFYKAYGGFRGRTKSYSSFLVYKLGAEVNYKRFGLGLDLVGYKTVIEDSSSHELESERQQINAQYNARSLRFNAKNPDIEEIYLWTSYEFETMSFLKLGVHQTFGTTNTAQGFGVVLELESSFRMADGGITFPYFMKARRRTKSDKNRVYLQNLGPDPDEKKESNKAAPIFR